MKVPVILDEIWELQFTDGIFRKGRGGSVYVYLRKDYLHLGRLKMTISCACGCVLSRAEKTVFGCHLEVFASLLSWIRGILRT